MPVIVDLSESIARTVAKSLTLGAEMAAPFLVIGTLFFVALGIMQKLLPQVQVFIVAMPIQIIVGLALMALTFGGMLVVWTQQVELLAAGFTPKIP
jgi:flagellar biosynthesis protein FliR